MGRKKIEIRPLVDERNRNVTFLKRKAGLMKKAWELSVLCAADVSIVIFSNTGKPYEFSSKDLDGEIDRYLEYEGMLERRRAPEFAAMAAAGEDDDDEDEEMDRRGSLKGKPGQPPAIPKSLKGKESFKPRQATRADMARARRTRTGDRHESEKRSFVEGIVSREESDDSLEEDKYRAGPSERPRQSQDMAGLQYALNMQSSQYPSSNSRMPYQQPFPDQPQHTYGQSYSYPQSSSQPGGAYSSQPGSLPQNMQWDQSLLNKYAEFQLQQNHQRQQRLLLERQRQQLAEIGVPVDDSGLLDQLFSSSTMAGQQQVPPPQHQQHVPSMSAGPGPAPSDDRDGSFVWPTESRSRSVHQGDAMPPSHGMLDHLYQMQEPDQQHHQRDDEGFMWPANDDSGAGFLPSPVSAEEKAPARATKRERHDEGRNSYQEGFEAMEKRARVY